MAGICYSELGQPDSARYYYNIAPPPVNCNDSIWRHHLSYLINKWLKHWNESEKELKISNDLSDEMILESTNNKYINLENSLDAEHLKAKNKRNYSIVGLSIGFLLLLISLICWQIIRHQKQKKNKEIEQLQSFINHLQQTNQQLSETNTDLSQQVLARETINPETITELTEAFRVILTQIRKKVGKDNGKAMNSAIMGALTPSYFKHLRQYVDFAHNGLASKLDKSEKLNEKEVNVVCMHICRIPKSIICLYTKHANPQSVSRYQNQIAQKYFGDKSTIDRFLSL